MAACHPPTRPIPSAVVTVGFGAEPEAADLSMDFCLAPKSAVRLIPGIGQNGP